MRPRIGLSSSTIDSGGPPHGLKCGVNHTYLRWVSEVGGLSVVLPNIEPEAAGELLDLCDALLLTGGNDIAPLHYGTEPHRHLGSIDVPRDRFELPLARLALERGLPILGICRGVQTLNVAAGGTLRQDLRSDPEATVQHSMASSGGTTVHHTIAITPGSLLHRLVGQESLAINSYHHQAVERVADGFTAVATAADGVIEAIEASDGRPFIGVQWHPEVLPGDPPATRALFAWLVEAAAAG